MFYSIAVALSAVRNSAYSRLNHYPFRNANGEASGGVVVPRADATAIAHKRLGRVLDDEAWGRELGQLARRRVEECFSLEAVGQQLRDFLLNRKVPAYARSPQSGK